MQITSSSIFITFIISGIFVLIFNTFLKNKKNYHLFRIDFLTMLAILIFLRLLLPVEFIFTITIESPTIMNPIQTLFLTPIYKNMLFNQFLLLAWIVVAILLFVHYIFVLCKLNKNTEKIISISQRLEDINCKYPVYQTNFVNVPTIFATKKTIFLPKLDYSSQELNDILVHETQHINNHDLLIKQLINILSIIYWWNPFVYVYKNQMQLLLEMRVDSKVTDTLTTQQSLLYTQSLVSIQKKIIFKKSKKNRFLSANFIDENENVLTYRINYLLENNFKHKTNKLFLCILFILPFLANSVILEASFEPENNNEYYEATDFIDGYITKEKDGTYILHFDGMDAIIESPKSSEFKDLPIFDTSKESD